MACSCGNPVVLYVWEGDGVLHDCSSGMACAMACCEREAWRLLELKSDLAALSLNGWPEDSVVDAERATRVVPRRVDVPEAFCVHGGG